MSELSLEEKKAIEELEELIKYINKQGSMYCDNEDKDNIQVCLNLIEKQSKEIEDLNFKYQARKDRTKKEIEELKEDNKHQWEERCKLTFELENSTSNDKIKSKIKEYKKQIEELKDSQIFTQTEYEGAIKVLQSLLEEE